MFFDKFATKKDGAIRSYDMSSPFVKVISIIILLLCFFIVLAALFPAVWVFLASFKTLPEFMKEASVFPKKIDFSLLKETWNVFDFTKFYKNSLITVVSCTVCAVVFNGLLAYGLAILKPKGHKIVYGLVMWSLMIPATTSLVTVVRNITAVHMIGTYSILWLAFGANAFYVVLFMQFFEELPKELLEAAKLDGCGVLGIFVKIMIPLSKPIITVVAIFAITAAWSDFLLPYLVLRNTGKETVMVKLFQFKDTPTNVVNVLRAVLFSIIPPTIIFALFQKQITDGAAAGAVKG